jgi:hypothetical protein
MPNITIEYVIMIPLLLMQIFVFPMAAGWLMNIWVDSRRSIALQDAASHLGSTIQQLYFTLNHTTVSTVTATYSPGLPPFIEDCYYVGNATLRPISGAALGSSKILQIRLVLKTTTIAVTESVILGYNAQWKSSTFVSNSTVAVISAQKFSNGTVSMRFGQ